MALVNMRDLVYHAYENRYALCSFDLVDIDSLHASLSAAEQTRSAVILNISIDRFSDYHFAVFMAAVERAAHYTQVPVAIQIDKVTTVDALHNGIKYGCNSVKLTTIKGSRNIAGLAHHCGISVEGKLANNLKDVFCDFIAVSCESACDGCGDSSADYRQSLQGIKVPIAIDCDADIMDYQFDPLIDQGVAKINLVGIVAADNAMEKQALRYMRLSGSAGHADAVIANCRQWTNIEHLIVYNTNIDHENDTRDMINKGITELARIPGVREVIAGKAILEDSRFTYTWLIRFCSREVVEFYKEHPLHKHFADHNFRPYALERITTDYVILNYRDGLCFDQDYYCATV